MICETGLEWKQRVCMGGCLMDGLSPCEGYLQGHHAIKQQHLKNHGLVAFKWCTDVGVCLCERHHRRFHNGRETIPYERLPDALIRFCNEYGIEWRLEKQYPRQPHGGAA